MDIRKAVFSGSWYPGDAQTCEKEIKTFLQDPTIQSPLKKGFVGGIVPHAGWYFSGHIACNVFHFLLDETQTDVLVVFGMHLRPDSSHYIMTEGGWETPFGDIIIESDMANALTERFDFQVERPDHFVRDNTIELQLPFIKYFFKNAKLVPIGAAPTSQALEIGKAVVEIAGQAGMTIKVIGSTDLTHYGPDYGFTPKGTARQALDWVTRENDAQMIDAVRLMDPERVVQEGLTHYNACCSGAAAAAVSAGKALGAREARIVKYATSYDKNPGNGLVGYLGMVF